MLRRIGHVFVFFAALIMVVSVLGIYGYWSTSISLKNTCKAPTIKREDEGYSAIIPRKPYVPEPGLDKRLLNDPRWMFLSKMSQPPLIARDEVNARESLAKQCTKYLREKGDSLGAAFGYGIIALILLLIAYVFGAFARVGPARK